MEENQNPADLPQDSTPEVPSPEVTPGGSQGVGSNPYGAVYRATPPPSTEGSTFSATIPPLPRSSAPSRPTPANPVFSDERSRRSFPFLLFTLIFLIGLMMIPWVAEQIVYATNRGKERAKAEAARQLLNEIRDPEQRIPWVAKSVTPSVVGIRTFTPTGQGVGMDMGSGVIVDTDGFILTNYHVVANAQQFVIHLNDGRQVEEVKVVGYDKDCDLAVLKIQAPHLEAITWGNSGDIVVGDQVVAIGNPFDLGQTVTSGIISATERYNPIPSRARYQEFLQTDAAINPGNSGGPLVNMRGELIGINTMIFSETGGNLGIGFAIPSLLARRIYEEILVHGKVEHGWLGIYMAPLPISREETPLKEPPKGVMVTGFLKPSPAMDAGIEPRDVITHWGETEIRDPLHMSHLIILAHPGETETVKILRDGKPMELEVTLGTRPVNLD